MTEGYEVITKDVIKERCDCEKKAICYRILELLQQGKWEEAEAAILLTKYK